MKKDKHHHPPLSGEEQRLVEEIERYFACDLTDNEERELRKKIMTITTAHPLVDEARAVMGFTTIHPAHAPQEISGESGLNHFQRGKLWFGIAAAVALVIVSALSIRSLVVSSPSDDRCFAYVDGQRIDQEDKVLEIIYGDMQELNDAINMTQVDIYEEMGNLAPAAETFTSQFESIL